MARPLTVFSPRRILLPLALSGIATLAGAQGYQGAVRADPAAMTRNPELAKVKVEQKLGQKIADAKLFADSGEPFTLSQVLARGRPVILLPVFYTCTGVCNLELNGVTAALSAMPQWRPGKSLEIVALGLRPKETPELARAKKMEMLRTYGDKTTADGWTFTVGQEVDVQAIARSFGFNYTYDPMKDRVNHPSGIVILTPDGTISSYILGVNYNTSKMDALLTTAAGGQVGQKTKEIFFGCVHIDPVTGERSLIIQNVLRVLGVITVVALVLSMLSMAGHLKWRFRRPAP